MAPSLYQVIAAYALRLKSWAGTEGSTVSSLICDRWLILGSEMLSISRCLNYCFFWWSSAGGVRLTVHGEECAAESLEGSRGRAAEGSRGPHEAVGFLALG